MKVSEAEKLVCPFISTTNRVISFNNNGYRHEVHTNKEYLDTCKCITTKCMAWKVTNEKYGPYCSECSKSFLLSKSIKICPDCGTGFEQSKEAPKDKQEGYCQRLKL